MHGTPATNKIPQTIFLIFSAIHVLVALWIVWSPQAIEMFSLPSVTDDSLKILFTAILSVYFLRLFFGTFFILKRKMHAIEVTYVAVWFALHFYAYAFALHYSKSEFNWVDIAGVALFIIGLVLIFTSELQRAAWKKNPANEGHLYTGGLFHYSRHINYFGDFLLTLGFALTTLHPLSLIVPVLLFLLFAFEHIPRLDAYLEQKYSQDFHDHAEKSKRFIPFIY